MAALWIRSFRDFPGGPGLRICLLMQGAGVQSLVEELRSHRPLGMAKEKISSFRGLLSIKSELWSMGVSPFVSNYLCVHKHSRILSF